MRALSFTGYLESYVLRLSGGQTLALRELLATAKHESRLSEPLLLWAVKSGKAASLKKLLAGNDQVLEELEELDSLEQQGVLETALSSKDSHLSVEYQKVWLSYLARANAGKRDEQLKLEARQVALDLEARKGVTRYRMAKDLQLNPGNLHAFLAQANVSKVSLDRALGLVRYLRAA